MHWREKNEDLGSGNSFQKSTGVKWKEFDGVKSVHWNPCSRLTEPNSLDGNISDKIGGLKSLYGNQWREYTGGNCATSYWRDSGAANLLHGIRCRDSIEEFPWSELLYGNYWSKLLDILLKGFRWCESTAWILLQGFRGRISNPGVSMCGNLMVNQWRINDSPSRSPSSSANPDFCCSGL
jgi:hypothetical protein